MSKLSWHGFFQFLMILAQVGNAGLAVVPDQYKVPVGAAIGFIQWFLHQYAFNTQPPKEKS